MRSIASATQPIAHRDTTTIEGGPPWPRMVLVLVHKQTKGEEDAVDEPEVEDVVTEVEINREAAKKDVVGVINQGSRRDNDRSNPPPKQVNRTINSILRL